MPMCRCPKCRGYSDSDQALIFANHLWRAIRGEKSPARAVLRVPAFGCQVTVDGVLNEPCYRRAALVTDFVIAGDAHRRAAATAAWLFWTDDRLVFALDCDDPTLVASPPSDDERDVDQQDRVELFLWITWIDARTPQPDFHVAGAFGTLVFDPKPETPPD